MVDSWSVPISTSSIDNLNDVIAKGPDLSWINNLANSYFQGKDQGYTQRNRDVFQGGLPKDVNGNFDPAAASQQLLQAGGSAQAGQISNLVKLPLFQQAIKQLQNPDSTMPSGGAVGPPSSATAIPSNNPGNIENGQFAAGQPGYVQSAGRFANFATPEAGMGAASNLLSSYGSKGVVTPNAIAAKWAPAGDGNNNPQQYGAFIAQQLGVPPDQPLDMNDPSVRMKIAGAIRQFEGNGSQAQPQGQPQPQAQPMQPGQAQAQPVPQQVAQNSPTPAGLQNADRLEQAAARAENLGNAMELAVPGSGKGYLQRGAELHAQAQAIRNTALKNQELTTTQRDVATGAAGATKTQELQATGYENLRKAIQGADQQFSETQKPYIDIAKSVLNDPRAYTGIGGNLSLDINRIKAAFGDTKAAMLQEALKKVTASNVLSQINNQRIELAEAGGTSSRIFRQQVALVEQAAPSLENTLAGNRALISIQDRMGQLSQTVAQQSRDYAKAHGGRLDSGFDQQLSDYLHSHPVFSQMESENPQLLGSPTLPNGGWNKQQVQQWATGMGLKSGDPIRTQSGTYIKAP